MARTVRSRDGNQRRLAPLRPRGYIFPFVSSVVSFDKRRNVQQPEMGLDLVPENFPSDPRYGVVELNMRASLDSNQTIVSAPSSESGTPTSSKWSASLSLLARKRRMTPQLVTPTSSVTSSKENGRWVQNGQTRKRRRSIDQRMGFPRPSMAESLLQVGLREDTLSPTQLEVMQDQNFVSLKWAFTTNSPPQADDPITETNQGLTPKTQPQIISSSIRETRKGVRTHGFSKEDAQKISNMRITRACLKCHLNKDPCDKQDPCAKCRKRLRKWKLGCTRARFEDFETSFPPQVLRLDLEWQRVYDLINGNAEVWIGRPFEIFIKQELGGPQPKLLSIWVREAVLLGRRLLCRPMQIVNGECVETIKQESPPILPYYQKDPRECQKIRDDILEWLHEIAETKSKDFHWYWYSEEDKDIWERSVLGEICNFFNTPDTSNSQVGDALLMTTLVYIMIHSFTIPEEQAEELYMRLSDQKYHRKPLGDVSPRAVNKFVAMLLLPELIKVCGKALANLKEQLIDCRRSREGFETSREVTFCVAYLTIMVIGHFQNTVLQYYDLDKVLDEQTTSREEAEREIRWLEELTHLITELTVVRLRKDQPRLGNSTNECEVETGSFFDLVRKATRESGEMFNHPAKYELRTIDSKTFLGTNARRILRKFYKAVQPVI